MQKRRAERDAFRWSARRNRIVYFTRPDSGRIRPRLPRTGPHARGISGGARTARRHNRGRPARFANQTKPRQLRQLPTLTSCRERIHRLILRDASSPRAKGIDARRPRPRKRFGAFTFLRRAFRARPAPPPNRRRKSAAREQSVISTINNSPRLPLMKSRQKIQINPAPSSKSHSKQFQSIDKKSILPSNRRIDHSSHQNSRPARLTSPSERPQPPQKSTFRLLFTRITQIYTNSKTITATINRK